MAMEYQNLDEVMGFIQRTVDSFGFHVSSGDGQSVGDKMCEAGAQAIHDRGIEQQRGGKSGAFQPNQNAEYIKWKSRKYHTTLANVRTNDGPGSLLNEKSIKGIPQVAATEVKWTYGLDVIPEDNIQCEDDMRRTDIEKARYAHEQGRAFFELSDETNIPMRKVAAEGLVEHIKGRSFK